MALPFRSSSTGRAGFSMDVDIDYGRVDNILKSAKRNVRRQVRAGMKRAGTAATLPRVRALTAGQYPKAVVSALTVRSTSSSAYVTTRGMRKIDRIAGLFEFGGVVSAVIRPVKAKAIKVGDGNIIRAYVAGDRRYTAKARIRAGVQASVPAFEEVLLSYVIDAFDGLPTTS